MKLFIRSNLYFNLFNPRDRKEIKNVGGWIYLADGRRTFLRRGKPYQADNNVGKFSKEELKQIRLYVIRSLKLYRLNNFKIIELAREIKNGYFKYSK